LGLSVPLSRRSPQLIGPFCSAIATKSSKRGLFEEETVRDFESIESTQLILDQILSESTEKLSIQENETQKKD
jgi:hypothetical protein